MRMRPPTLPIVIGIWLIFAPLAWFALMAIAQDRGYQGFVAAIFGGLLFSICCAILYRFTRGYLQERRGKPE